MPRHSRPRRGPSLIIDDHPSCRASARHVLEGAGFVVIGEAQDGASGLAAATEMRPAVVLLDVQLPTSMASTWPPRSPASGMDPPSC
ncbi:MAG: response regulator [Solirubrobacteraceae bacterium]